MDSATIRLVAQVALTTWAMVEICMLVCTRGRVTEVTGVRWAVGGLVCFAGWTFLLSLSSAAVNVIPRGDFVWWFAALEVGVAVGAWGWLLANMRARFRVVR